MTVFRDEESDDFEDFGDANISAWLISLHGDIPVTATVYEATVTIHVPRQLAMGVYGVKVIWTKEVENTEYHSASTKDLELSEVNVDNVFAIVNDNNGTSMNGLIQFDVQRGEHIAFKDIRGKCSRTRPKEETKIIVHDGKSAYQYAVEHGFSGTEDEFGQMLAEFNLGDPSLRWKEL